VEIDSDLAGSKMIEHKTVTSDELFVLSQRDKHEQFIGGEIGSVILEHARSLPQPNRNI